MTFILKLRSIGHKKPQRQYFDKMNSPPPYRVCTFTTLLPFILIAKVAALTVATVVSDSETDFWVLMALLSLFLLWIAIMVVISLCLLQSWLRTLSLGRQIGTIAAIVALWLVGVTELTQHSLGSLLPPALLTLSPYFRWQVYLLGLLSLLLGTRYLYVLLTWRQQVEQQAELKLQHLQARIRPHFLFNSLNTIAALIPEHPQVAEAAVLDFADLMRSHIHQQRILGSVGEEITLCQRYLGLEQLRLGERLRCCWQIEPGTEQLQLPLLTLQPLLENSIYHGIEPSPSGGEIRVTIQIQKQRLKIVVSNRVEERLNISSRQHNHTALENIATRLRHCYGSDGSITSQQQAGLFTATIELPVQYWQK
ncbi:hypothetical protein D5085_08770 [Ectothiorhodospiraceae bacterium BW-2]|nr:hypothetical protein D5085_08770 [Ectothiorhodospiraceae bacterium BW-2]